MGKKWEQLKKRYQEDRQLRQKLHIGCLLLAVCCLLAGIFARYVYQTVSGMSQVTADNFYFTANLLGDTTMVPEEGEAQESYAFTEKSTEGIWYLYGANTHSVKIRLQNYFDELRVTEKDIAYTGEVSVYGADGTEITKTSGGAFPGLEQGGQIFSEGTLQASGNGSKVQEEILLSIPSYTDWNYADGTVVTAKIASTSPYRKTLTLKFVLYAADTTLKYKVIDSAGSPYAELILMTNAEGTVQPYLEWADALSIDNTNPLTFTYTDGVFTQQSGMAGRNMQVSEALSTGRSESIYFFKKDTSKNYSQGEQVVNPDSDGKYLIKVGK